MPGGEVHGRTHAVPGGVRRVEHVPGAEGDEHDVADGVAGVTSGRCTRAIVNSGRRRRTARSATRSGMRPSGDQTRARSLTPGPADGPERTGRHYRRFFRDRSGRGRCRSRVRPGAATEVKRSGGGGQIRRSPGRPPVHAHAPGARDPGASAVGRVVGGASSPDGLVLLPRIHRATDLRASVGTPGVGGDPEGTSGGIPDVGPRQHGIPRFGP